ncbi:hypothetical protein HDE_06482 [Halotydeus destructor]|nr:hypothetical protein HDE_06482 [Halotydeus destructor]
MSSVSSNGSDRHVQDGESSADIFVDSFANRHDAYEAENERLVLENEELKARSSQAVSRSVELSSKVEMLTIELATARDLGSRRSAKYESEIEKLKKHAKQSADAYDEKLVELQTELSESNSCVMAKDEQLRARGLELEKTRKKLQEVEAEVVKLETNISKMTQDTLKASEEHKLKLSAAESRNRSDRMRYQETVVRLETRVAELVRFKDLSIELGHELKKEESSLVAKQEELRISELELAETRKELQSLQNITARLTAKHEESRQRESQLKGILNEVIQLNESVSRLESDAEETRGAWTELAKCQETVAHLEAVNANHVKAVRFSDGRIRDLQAGNASLEAELEQVKSANETLRMSLASAQAKVKDCPVCLVSHSELQASDKQIVALTSCGHVFCGDCANRQREVQPSCPMCKASFAAHQLVKLFF